MSSIEWKDMGEAIDENEICNNDNRRGKERRYHRNLVRSTWPRRMVRISNETEYIQGRGGGLTYLALAA